MVGGAVAAAGAQRRWWNITYPVWRSVRTGWSSSGESARPFGVSDLPTRSHTQEGKKWAFKSLSCKTWKAAQLKDLSTCSCLTLGVSLFSFWPSRCWQHSKASAVTCATTNRTAARGIVGNGVFDQTNANVFLRRWREAFWLRMKYFWGSNFSQDAFRPTLRTWTAICARSVHGYWEHLRQFCLLLVFHSNRVSRSAHQSKTCVSWNCAPITAHLITKDAYDFRLIDRTLYGDVNSTF